MAKFLLAFDLCGEDADKYREIESRINENFRKVNHLLESVYTFDADRATEESLIERFNELCRDYRMRFVIVRCEEGTTLNELNPDPDLARIRRLIGKVEER